jgi:hypothetical protein
MARAACKDNDAAAVRTILPYADATVLLECMRRGYKIVYLRMHVLGLGGVNVLTTVGYAA